MNANQKRKAERLSSIVGYLKFAGRQMTSTEIHKELSALGASFSSIQEYLRELVGKKVIHSIVEPRTDNNGGLIMLYAYGPTPSGEQSRSIQRHQDISAQCIWRGANDWQRGQHGRDLLQAALFGEVRP